MTKAALRRMVVVLVVVVVTVCVCGGGRGGLYQEHVSCLHEPGQEGQGGSFAWEVNVASLVLKSEAGCRRTMAFLYVAEHNRTEREC